MQIGFTHLVERVLVELAAEGLLGVEVGRVEHRSPEHTVGLTEGRLEIIFIQD